MKEKLELYKKLHSVRESIHSIAYDEVNTFEKFAYVSSAIVLRNIRKLLNENRLVLETSIVDSKATILENGKTIFTEITSVFRFVCIDTGAYTELKSIGQGLAKSSEKGVGKAMTYQEKYFLLKYFNLPTHKVDDPDFKREIDNNQKEKTNNAKVDPPVASHATQVKNNVSPESPPQDQEKTPVEDENQYSNKVFSFFDKDQQLDVAKFATESAQKQGVSVERLFESASKRKEDFIKAFKLWSSAK